MSQVLRLSRPRNQRVKPIIPIILSGGAGSRLWPLSNEAQPKQFHALIGDLTMFGETLTRVQTGPDIAFAAPIIVCGQSHEANVLKELKAAGQDDACLILEPLPRNTAPALAAAALLQAEKDPEALMLVLPADHVITKPEGLRAACNSARAAATEGKIVTFAIVPNGPETGYGYIKRGVPLGPDVFEVAAFREKPDLETAKAYVASGAYAWNAGIFFFKASTLIDALRHHAPQILVAAEAAVQLARREGPSIFLDEPAFAASPSQSIDYAVMEHTSEAAVVPVDMGWNDVGSFATLHQLGIKDANDNLVKGPVALFDTQNSLVITQTVPVSVIGLENIMVIVTQSGVLVAPIDRAQDVRLAAEAFKLARTT